MRIAAFIALMSAASAPAQVSLPRLRPPASSMYSLPASAPYDELNVRLRRPVVAVAPSAVVQYATA